MRVCVSATALAACIALALPAVARAYTTRYAVVGGVTTGECTSPAPGDACDLRYAVETKAAPVDTVRLAPGTYDLGNSPLQIPSGVWVVGDQPSSKPLLTGTGASVVHIPGPSPAYYYVTALYDLRFHSGSPATYPLLVDYEPYRVELWRIEALPAQGSDVAAQIDCSDTRIYDSVFVGTLNLTSDIPSGSCGLDHDTIGGELVASAPDAGPYHVGVSAENTAIVVGARLVGQASGTMLNSITPSYPGWGCSFDDESALCGTMPQFVDAPHGDYHEVIGSPTWDTARADGYGGCCAFDGSSRGYGHSPDVGAYELPPTQPRAQTGDATQITSDSADLHGIANPNVSSTNRAYYYFDYGASTNYGNKSGNYDLRPNWFDQDVDAVVGQLPSGGTAHYRLVVVTPDGTALGADRSFAVPPASVDTQLPDNATPAGPPVGAGRVQPRLTVSATIRRSTGRFQIRGHVLPPSGPRANGACAGPVAVRIRIHGHSLSTSANVSGDCLFAARGRRHRLRDVRRASVSATFGGNDALLPARSRAQLVRLL